MCNAQGWGIITPMETMTGTTEKTPAELVAESYRKCFGSTSVTYTVERADGTILERGTASNETT